MAQDDHKQRSGGIKSSKKLKQKKVPQRGLGVAQLEKIRLEDHQKKNVVSPRDLQSVLRNNNPLLVPNFRQNSHPEFYSNSVFKTNPCSDFSNKQLNLGSLGKLWNGEHTLEGERYKFDQSGGFIFRPKVERTYESMPILPAPSGILRKELFQPQNSSSSMVKVSSGTSSSSVITYNQMEPPSNQSFNSKIYSSRSKWPEEEKMIGIKRSYPFSLDSLSSFAYPHKFPAAHVQYPACRSVESPSRVIGGLVHVEPQKPLLRGPASLNVMPEMRTGKLTEKHEDLNGDFLTLALPKPPSPHPTRELSEAGPNIQENVNGPSFYSFFPSSKALNDLEPNNITSSSGEVAEKLDLNLKL